MPVALGALPTGMGEPGPRGADSTPHLRGHSQRPAQLSPRPISWALSWPTLTSTLIYDLLECRKGLVLWNGRIFMSLHVWDNSRLPKKNCGKGSVMMCARSQGLEPEQRLIAMNILWVWLIGQKGCTMWHTAALDVTKMNEECWKDWGVGWGFFVFVFN